MSKRLQHILTELEATPPAGVWDRLVPELDEMNALRPVAGRLQQVEEAPPPAAWDSIREQLSEISIGKKLLELEVPAPAMVWPQVTASLEEKQPRRLRPYLRLAVAAILTGALVWAGIRFLSGGPSTQTPLAEAKDMPAIRIDEEQAHENLAAIIADTRPVADALEEARNDAALEASKKTMARVDVSEMKRKLQQASAYNFDLPGSSAAPPAAISSTDDRYILMATCDGQVLRLSKKLADISCCIAGENRNPDCLDQLRKWQEKMLNAKGSHAPGNFTDILDILNALRENR